MRRCWPRLGLGVLVLLLALPALLVEASPAAQKGLRLVRLSVFSQDAATLVASERGWFAAEGIEVQTTITPSSTAQMQGLVDGAFDVVSGGFDNVLAWSGRDGVELVAVVQTALSPDLPLFVRPEIQTWDDLRGRRLGADAVDTAFALVLRRMLLEHGLDLDRGDYSLVAEGNTPQRFESMQRGDTYAAILSTEFADRAMAAGFVPWGDHRAVLPDYPGGVLAVRRDWAAANRPLLVGYLRAYLAGSRWVEDNQEAATDLLATRGGISRAAAAERLRLGDRALNVAGLASVLDLRTRFGLTPPLGGEVARYYDTSYYSQAIQAGQAPR
jgi:ABC-type nitrate/sulfonate/bicarbonate transport system substrate-binding protein